MSKNQELSNNNNLEWSSDITKGLQCLAEFQERYWTTKSNETIKIKNLTLNHLNNIIKNLKKQFKNIENPMNNYPSFGGEMAQMQAEREWEYSIAQYRQIKRNLELFKLYYKLKTIA